MSTLFSSSTLAWAAGWVVLCALLAYRWQRGILFFFLWLCVEDFIRKGTGNNISVYFAKTILVLILYFSYLLWRDQHRLIDSPRLRVKPWLALWFAYAVLNCFNPAIPHWSISVLGIHMNFLYVPLLFLGYHFAQDYANVRRFFAVMLISSFVVINLGFLQYVFGPGFLNFGQYEMPHLRLVIEPTVPGTGEKIHTINSVFVDPGRFSRFVWCSFWLGIAWLSFYYALHRRLSWRAVVLFLPAAAAIWQVGRGPAIATIVALAIWSVVLLLRHRISLRVASVPLILTVPGLIMISLWLVVQAFPGKADVALLRLRRTVLVWDESNEILQRVPGYLSALGGAARGVGWFGMGTGMNSLGQQYLPVSINPIWGVESGYGAVLVEFGYVGFVCWLGTFIFIFLDLLRCLFDIRGSPYWTLGLPLVVSHFVFIHIYIAIMGLQPFQDYIFSSYFWFTCGLLCGLPQLIRQSPLTPQGWHRGSSTVNHLPISTYYSP